MATPWLDYKLDTNDNLMIANGDFVVGESDNQHIKDTIIAMPGWYKQDVNDGVGISAYYKARIEIRPIENKLRQQLTSDGYTVNTPIVKLENNKLKVIPNAVRL